MELPDINTVVPSNRNDVVVIKWVKLDVGDWVSVADKGLELARHVLLGVVVPHLDHVVFAASQHKAAIL
jgi:hypothetical protein